ncbi:hypothetical protein JR316_0007118 [Psilocybe cubensis]|uniref:Uncharacterized protein n=1 Tax=Psilocybe cubensis TaxID=181762 RepID=A0ACB8GY07_PSICU|nr:hypothetical protein JR316_0007118 [Psilocybe cubensis]KAH9480518.1 hypothetical protein JR316_0007118 [Psilocybe cubensis]
MDNIDINSEYSESSSITFEWTLSGLKSLFDSTKGDKKSKVTKSIRFGNNRWQILFYANAGPTKDGTEGGGFVSLYLSCEPTVEEKEASLWVREGVYKFSFELRNVGKNVLYNAKEAHNHSFTYKTANWGWAQFARRDSVYYQSLPVKAQDAFVIICTITSSPAAPSQTLPRQPVPKALLDTVGSLLDDPLYSDVQFIIPNRHQSLSNARKIWASKKLLQRSEYFETMFNSNFAEGVSDPLEQSIGTPQTISHTSRRSHRRLNMILDEFEDSDNDDEEFSESRSRRLSSSDGTDDFALSLPDSNTEDGDRSETQSTISEAHFASPPTEPFSEPVKSIQETIASVPPKMTIVVRDAAYNTYRAMLYYIYTNNIVFAPLSSSFLAMPQDGTLPPSESIPSTPSEGCQVPGAKRISSRDQSSSRAEWIKEWMAANPGRPAPCSAKSMYRIADRLDMSDLKERAAQHILKSLTVDNIGYEVFSPFAAAFEAIRKVEVEFFLSHWHEIRASETMKNVWLQIRNGRHPGFEEVWPLIAQSLEFNPSTGSGTSTSPKAIDT